MEERPGTTRPGPPGRVWGGPWRQWQDGELDQQDPGHLPGHWHGRRHGLFRFARGPKGEGPLRRVSQGRLIGGVAEGLAVRTGFDVTLVRTVLVLAGLISGFGAAAYVLAWLLIPEEGADTAIATKALTDRRGIGLAAATGALLVVLLLIASALGASWVGSLAWPAVISVAGLVLVVRNATADEQETLRRLAEPLLALTESHRRSRVVLRGLIAAVLLAVGLAILLSGHKASALLLPLGGVALVMAAIVVVLGPWWLRVARDLVVERQARARAEERADMAARVHDSVLQTLALIQRRSGDPQEIVKLARAQERELRSWLFDGRAPGTLDEAGMTFAGGVRLIEQEVESAHGVAVDAVIVGDCELDDDLRALLAAGREATVNAVKWSGADVVSIFAEVEPGEVSIFVRDRGQGFDPAAVPSDRKGLAESIRGRMTRRGGSAAVRSAAGEGTEVSLTMPRTAAGRREQSSA
ncbi:MAG: PspC domain-containing protein [Actinomycetota bacterium]